MTAELATPLLTRDAAAQLTDRIRTLLERADTELVHAWEGRAWQALGFPSFADWCLESFPGLQVLRLGVPARRDRVLRLVESGASMRDTAAASGVSVGTIAADVKALEKDGRLVRPETVRGADGVHRPATAPRPVLVPVPVDRHGLTELMHDAWTHVQAAGLDGLTCPELEKVARWRHGRTSSLLHRLERAGHVVRDGQVRVQYGTRHAVYTARPLPTPNG